MDVKADEAGEGEVEFAHAVPCAVDFAIEGEEEGDGVFCDGVRGVGGDADDGEAEGFGGGEVDVIEASAAEGEEADAVGGEDFEGGSVGLVVDEEADGGCAGGGGGGFRAESEFVESPDELISAWGVGEVFAVVGFGVEDGDGVVWHGSGG